MIEDTLSNIEEKIQASDSIKDERKRELLHSLASREALEAALAEQSEKDDRRVLA